MKGREIGMAWLQLVLVSMLVGCGGRSHRDVVDAGSPDAGAVDAAQFCVMREAWICARQRARGELTAAEETDCVNDVGLMCDGVAWPAGCTPTEARVDACIMALQDPTNLDSGDALPQCDTAEICR